MTSKETNMASPERITQGKKSFGDSFRLLSRRVQTFRWASSAFKSQITTDDVGKPAKPARDAVTAENGKRVEHERNEDPSVSSKQASRMAISFIPPVALYAVIRGVSEWFEEIGLLSDLGKDLMQFAAAAMSLIMLLFITRHSRANRLVNITWYLGAGAFLLARLLDVSDEIVALEHVVLLGKYSPLNGSLRGLFDVSAICLMLFIIYSLTIGLAQSEGRFRQLAEITPAATAILRGNIVCYANSIAEQMFGLNQSSDWSLLSESIPKKEERDSLQSMVKGVYREDGGIASGIKNCVVEIKTKSQDTKWMGVTVSGIVYKESPAILFTAHDVTDLKYAERVEAERQKELLYVQKLEAQRVLAGGVAHRFNTLLTRISANLSLLEEDSGSASNIAREIQVIENAVDEAASLSKEMIAYSGNGRFRVESLNLSNLIEKSREFLETVVSDRAMIVYDLAPDLPEVECDVSEIRHLLCNLMTNASEALGEDVGTIVVSTGVCQRRKLEWTQKEYGSSLQDPYVFLSVSDTGMGMETEEIEKTFDPFFTTKGVGRGLGLAAAQGIVHGHGGVIEVDSCPNQGSTFKVCLPAVISSEVIHEDETTTVEIG